MIKEPYKCPKMHKCPHYKKLLLIEKYLPSIIHEAFTSAVNSGIIESKVSYALKKLVDNKDVSSD